MPPIYEVNNLTQRYQGRTVLEIDSLTIERQSIVGLTGHNGSGKSTLMRMLAFLERPAQGDISYDGRPAGPESSRARREVTLLTQEPYLLKRTVKANVGYGLKIRGAEDTEQASREALEMVGLKPDTFLSRSWYELSGGEAQRVALASRLVLKPKVLLLDEPTASLDRESSTLIKQAATRAREEWGTTLVVVSHDLPWLQAVCDSFHTFFEGRLRDEAILS